MQLSVLIVTLLSLLRTVYSSELKSESSELVCSPQNISLTTDSISRLHVQDDDDDEFVEGDSVIIYPNNIDILDDYELYITEKIMPLLENNSICTLRCFSVTLLVFMAAAIISYFVMHSQGLL